jgi:flagellar hook-length control protein FliK
VESQTADSVESVQFVTNEQAASVDNQKTAVPQKGSPESVQVLPRVATASLVVPVESELARAVVPSEKTEPMAVTPTQKFVGLTPVVMSEKPTAHSAEPVQSVAVQSKIVAEPVQVSTPLASIVPVEPAEPEMTYAVVPSETAEPIVAAPMQAVVALASAETPEQLTTRSVEHAQADSVLPKFAAESVQVSPQATTPPLVMSVESEIVHSGVEMRNKVAQIVDATVPQAAKAVQQPATTSVAGLQESRPVVQQVAVELPVVSIAETAQRVQQVSPSQLLQQNQHQEPAVEGATAVVSRQIPETQPSSEAPPAHTETIPLRTADVSRASLSTTDNLQNADNSSPKPVSTDAQSRETMKRVAEIAELDLQLAQARPITTTKGAVESVPATSARGAALLMPEARNGRTLLGRQQLFDNNRMTGEQSPGKELGTSGSADLVSGKIIAEAVTAVAGNEEQKMEDGLVDQQPQAHNFGGVLNQEHQKTSAVAGKMPVMEAVRQEVPDQIMQQVKDRLEQHDLKPGNQQITLTLAPDTLGELKMNLNLQGQKLSVEIITENRVVRDAIAQHTETLKESLAKQNIAMESFDVTTGGKGSGGQGQQNQSAWRELVKQQQQQQFWAMPRGYTARADAPTVSVPYQKPQGHAMLDIHY